ncbi:GtrA family protein [Dyella soli]|uniref:GtrA family protein n=1 Tax=Dyella soli TaxID=522319 RepID=A0A4R0YTS3_9GAMM|nr:GtrA family protein [Dyella soli]TCI09902.1 GtrA family protein [Dyella soli]
MRLRRQVLLFAIGGLIGLVVDAGVVQALVSFGHWNPYLARVLSFVLAATATWLWNRRFTFGHRHSGRSLHAEWLHWVALMSVGAVVNYAAYAAILMLYPWLHRWPAVAVAASSAAASLVNFATARGVLFKSAKTSA